MHRTAPWFAWLSVLAGGTLAAQGRPLQTIEVAALRQGLASTVPTVVAWAAHDARAARSKPMVAPLQRALGTWRRSNGGDAQLVCLYLLDALIGLEAKVPAGELVDLVDVDHCGAAAFVLLVRECRTNQSEMLAMFRRDAEPLRAAVDSLMDPFASQRERRTLILGDELARHAPPGFVTTIAPWCDWRLRVVVHDPGTPVARVRSAISANGPPLDRAAAGWPPRPAIWLEHPVGKRSDVPRIRILPGLEHEVTREERKEAEEVGQQLWSFSLVRPRPRQFEVQLYIRWLVTVGGGEHPELYLAVPYDTDGAFVTAAVAAREKAQTCVNLLRTRLVARGAMTVDEAAKWLPTRLEVDVQDLRSRVAGLPALPESK